MLRARERIEENRLTGRNIIIPQMQPFSRPKIQSYEKINFGDCFR
jgi:hypothetical protein